MSYNWQQPDWPKFKYDSTDIEQLLFDFAEKAGRISGFLKGMSEGSQTEAMIDMMVSEAIKTSEIEGEYLSRKDVMSSIRNNLGLVRNIEQVQDKRAEGIAELIINFKLDRMKKITIKKAFAILAFIFIGNLTFSQIQPAGIWSAEGDLNILKVTGDADNGDGASDGALSFEGASSVVGQGGVFTFDGTMQEGKNYAINSAMYNANGSYVQVRVTLHNKTDNTELAVDVNAGSFMGTGIIHTVAFNYTAVASDAGDTLELRFIRNDDGYVVRSFRIDNAKLNGATLGARVIVYSEDFRYADIGRGFVKGIITDDGAATTIWERNNSIPELTNSNNLFDPTTDREAKRIPNGGTRDQKMIQTTGDNGTTNFAVDAYAVFTTLDLTSANALINPSDDYVYATFWTQRRYGNGDIASVTMRVATDYAGDASTATWTTLSLHSGKIGDSSDGRKFVKGMVDLSGYTGSTTVTLAIRYLGSSSAYSTSNRNGTFMISDLQFITQETPIKNVWDGSTDSDLTEPANWDTKAAPVTTTNNLVIPSGLTNYPTATAALTVNSLTLESGSSFITNSTVTGNVTYKRNLSFASGNLEGWHLVGSPVSGQTYNDGYVTANSIASGSGSNRGIATYDNSVASNNWTYLQSTGSGTFGNGAGYSIKTSATTDVSFTGTLNTDNVAKGITIGAGTAFNLISNPFTSFINSGTFLTTNTAKLTSETIWVLNPTTKNYDAKVTGDAFKVAPGQGFFVSCGTAGDVTFNEAIQSHQGTDTFLKSSPKPEVQLNITDGDLNRYAKIYYNENATTSFDNGYDGATFTGVANKLDVFTQLLANNQGKNYQVQSLPNSDLASMVIPVGLKSEAGKEITFTAEALNLPDGIKVFLEDRLTNVFTRLDETNSDYKIALTEALNGVGRFYLHTNTSVLRTDNIELENVSIYKTANSILRIAGLKQVTATVKLFNILGKQVMNSSFKTNGVKDISLPKLATGVYIVQLITESGKLNKKIILE